MRQVKSSAAPRRTNNGLSAALQTKVAAVPATSHRAAGKEQARQALAAQSTIPTRGVPGAKVDVGYSRARPNQKRAPLHPTAAAPTNALLRLKQEQALAAQSTMPTRGVPGAMMGAATRRTGPNQKRAPLHPAAAAPTGAASTLKQGQLLSATNVQMAVLG